MVSLHALGAFYYAARATALGLIGTVATLANPSPGEKVAKFEFLDLLFQRCFELCKADLAVDDVRVCRVSS